VATWLHGDGTGAIATTPDSAGLSITGDLDLRIRARADDWSPSPNPQWLIAKRHAASGTATGEWQWGIEDDAQTGTQMSRFRWYNAASATFTTVTTTRHPGVDGQWLSLRVTIDVDDGAGGKVVAFYYSTMEDLSAANWTVWGQFTSAGTTDIRGNVATLVEIGSAQSGADWPFVGDVAKAQIRSGIDGTLVASPDFTQLVGSQTSYTDAQGNVWTFGAGASVNGSPDATGFTLGLGF
jgi:hypothetical protein